MRNGKTQCSPAEVGYDPSRLDAVDRHLTRLIEGKKLQAAGYCVSRDGKVFAHKALGKFSFREDDERELEAEGVHWIASITKLFCATAIFKLVEDGLVRPNQAVGEILPEMSVPPYNAITIAMLLSHTSGLSPDDGCFENKYYKGSWHFIQAMPGTPWLEAGLSAGMRSKPGTEWAYCSFGFLILGELVTRVAGMNVHDFIAKEILEPCGMADSGFLHYMLSRDAQRAKAEGFMKRMTIRDADDERFFSRAPQTEEEAKHRAAFKDVPGTGGGLVSTAADLCKFGNMLMNNGTTLEGKRVLGRRTVARMTELYTGPEIRDYCWGAPGPYRMYALGPDKRRTADSLYSPSYFYHEGAGGCALIVDPEEKTVGVWFVPFVDDVWNPAAIYGTGAVIWSGLK